MSATKDDGSAGALTKSGSNDQPIASGAGSQLQRIMALGSYFVSGTMAINAFHALGSPLYLMNKEWYDAWMAFTKQSFGLLTMTMTQFWAPTVVRVSGDKSVRGQLKQGTDDELLCTFPERLVMIANHQIYTDWLYLWWMGYNAGMHGRVFIVLKESLKRLPVIGWGMQVCQFVFLRRDWEQDKPQLAAHMQKLNKANVPMWLMLFPEGTNLAPSTREASYRWAAKNGINDMQHTLLPRYTGLQFMLKQLRPTLDYVYDCTIAYEGVPRGEYAQDIFTLQASYLGGHPPKSVNMHWRRFPVSSIPIDDTTAFETWLRARWIEKDYLIESYLRTGRFPADTGVSKMRDGRILRGAKHIETTIKAHRWYEFLQVFAPIGVFALVLYMFYDALPKGFLKQINKQTIFNKIQPIQKALVRGTEQRLRLPSELDAASSTQSIQIKNPLGLKALRDVGSSVNSALVGGLAFKEVKFTSHSRGFYANIAKKRQQQPTKAPSRQPKSARVNTATVVKSQLKSQPKHIDETAVTSNNKKDTEPKKTLVNKSGAKSALIGKPKKLEIRQKGDSTPKKLTTKPTITKSKAKSSPPAIPPKSGLSSKKLASIEPSPAKLALKQSTPAKVAVPIKSPPKLPAARAQKLKPKSAQAAKPNIHPAPPELDKKS